MRIRTGVVAVVYSAQHERRLARTKLGVSHFHAIHRSTRATPHLNVVFRIDVIEPEKVHGECSTTSRASSIRSAHYDVAEVFHHADKLVDALCLIAVIIGNEYKRSVRI